MKKVFLSVSMFLAMLISTQDVLSGELAVSSAISDKSVSWGPCPAFFPKGCELAVIHGDATKANSDIYFKIPGGYSFPAHWHTSAERMVLVSGEMDVTYKDQPTTHLKTGMYAYGPAKAIHEGKCISKEVCILVIAFEQPVDAFEAHLK